MIGPTTDTVTTLPHARNTTPATLGWLRWWFTLASLLLAAGVATAQDDPKQSPKNPKQDVSKIGDRGVGEGTFNMYTLRKEQQMGRNAAKAIEQTNTIVEDPVVAEYVNRIAQNIARNSDTKVPVTAKVILSDAVNAMALPGGYIFINSGLINLAGDEAELAGVLGHEVAHVAARHGARTVTRATAATVAANVAIALLGPSYSPRNEAIYQIANFALPMAFLKFSRDFERQADLLGVQYLYAAGYDPLGMVTFFERLAALAKRDERAVSNLFSSHPMKKGRVRRTQKAIDEILPEQPLYRVTGSEFDAMKARLAAIATTRPYSPGQTRRQAPTNTRR